MMEGDKYSVFIRDATRQDMVQVDEMIQELAVVEKLTGDAQINAQDLMRDGFGERPLFGCKVAVWGSQLVGYALFYRTYSTCTGGGLMLEDLYVREGFRCKGVGSRLFGAVAAEGLSLRCARLELHVLGWNPATSFYEARGAQDMSANHWRYYRLDRDQMRKAAEEGSQATKDSKSKSSFPQPLFHTTPQLTSQEKRSVAVSLP